METYKGLEKALEAHRQNKSQLEKYKCNCPIKLQCKNIEFMKVDEMVYSATGQGIEKIIYELCRLKLSK